MSLSKDLQSLIKAILLSVPNLMRTPGCFKSPIISYTLRKRNELWIDCEATYDIVLQGQVRLAYLLSDRCSTKFSNANDINFTHISFSVSYSIVPNLPIFPIMPIYFIRSYKTPIFGQHLLHFPINNVSVIIKDKCNEG